MKRICSVLSALTLLMNIFAVPSSSSTVSNAAVCIEIIADGISERVDLFMPDEEHALAFLPSYASESNTFFRVHTGSPVTIGGQKLMNGDPAGKYMTAEETDLVIGKAPPVKLRFIRSGGAAAMYIQIKTKRLDAVLADKNHKGAAQITLYSPEGQADYQTGKRDRIRGRGNWSWQQEKKPFNLYLEEAADLLGLGTSQNWALLANALDETNLRNWLALSFADEIAPYGGFAPDCAFVDLYLNGEYQGLYLLCERVEIAENRLETSSDSMLFLLDAEERMDGTHPYFPLNPGIAAEIRSPSDCSEEQAGELKLLLSEMQNAFLAEESPSPGDQVWSDYIDMDSWARKYLMEEIFLNFDAGAQSQYFFLNEEDGRIYAGPCWDYDNILGVFGYGLTPRCFMAQREWKTAAQYTPWFGALWKKAEFSSYVKEIYAEEFRPALQTLAEEIIPQQAEIIRDAAEADRQRWPSLLKQYPGYDEALSAMLTYLEDRIDFLDSAWIDGTEYCTITLKSARGEYRFFCVPSGSICEDLPTPEEMNIRGVKQWQYEDTGLPFDYDTVIRGDIDLFAAK